MFSGKALSTARKPVELTDICDLITSTGAVKTTTKKWEQSANCATWRVPANGVYFIAGQIGNFNDSSWLDYLQGRIEIGNRVVAYAGQQSVPTNTKNCIQISTIQKLNEGDVIRMDPWTDMAGCTVETQLHIVRILNLSGGGCLKLIYSVASLIGGFHVFGNRKGECKTDYLGRTGASGNHQSQTRLGEPGWNLHSELPVVRIVRTGSGYCVLGNIESRNESATQLLRPCALRGRESTQDGFWTQRHQRSLFADLGDLIGGGLNA